MKSPGRSLNLESIYRIPMYTHTLFARFLNPLGCLRSRLAWPVGGSGISFLTFPNLFYIQYIQFRLPGPAVFSFNFIDYLGSFLDDWEICLVVRNADPSRVNLFTENIVGIKLSGWSAEGRYHCFVSCDGWHGFRISSDLWQTVNFAGTIYSSILN